MRRKITIINPTPAKKIKRIKSRKKRVLKKRRTLRNKPTINKLKRSAAVAVTKKRRSRKRRAVRKNPGGVTYVKNRRRVKTRSRVRRRKMFRNPIDAMTGGKTTDLLVMGAGAGIGGVATPWLGNIFQLTGMVKYAAQAAIAVAGYYMLNKIGMKKAALPFAAAGIGVTAYQFAQENNILAGLGSDELTTADLQRLDALSNGMGAIPYDQSFGAVAYNQPMGAIPLNQMAGGGGYDDDTANADYY